MLGPPRIMSHATAHAAYPPREKGLFLSGKAAHHKIDIYGSFALVAGILCWGVTPVILRMLIDDIDAWTANGIRYPLAALMYWPIMIYSLRRGTIDLLFVKRCLVPALLAMSAQILWALAPYYLPASAIGFSARLAMVVSIIIAVILFHDERRLLKVPIFYVGLGLSISGFLFLSISLGMSSEHVKPLGILIMLGCAVCFGMYAVSVRIFLKGLAPVTSFGVVAQIVSVGLISCMFAFGNPAIIPSLNSRSWGLLVVSTTLGIAFGHMFLYTAIHRLGATITTSVQNLTPFFTAILASLLLGERLTLFQWLGGVAMVMGATLLLTTQRHISMGSGPIKRRRDDTGSIESEDHAPDGETHSGPALPQMVPQER